jgi:hypothetical protein
MAESVARAIESEVRRICINFHRPRLSARSDDLARHPPHPLPAQGEQMHELGSRLRALATREAEAYSVLAIVTDVVEHLEDSGDEKINAFGPYNGGGGIAKQVQAVIRFLNG